MKRLHLPSNWIHLHYESVASTMLCCDPAVVEPGQFLLVTADEQTAGRGQRGTHWESSRGENLTFNIGWRTSGMSAHWPAANEQFLISEVTALAVAKALSDAGVCPSIKWPNDIYVGERKICGMLLEHQLSGRCIEASIAGIGINVNQTSFATEAGHTEGRGAPISLRQIVGHEVSREAVLESFVSHFQDGVSLLGEGRYDEVERDYTALLFRRTGLHRYRDSEGSFLAEFVSIGRNGLLTLRKASPHLAASSDAALRTYAFKEVTYEIGD